MPTLRFQALREASNRKPVQFEETDRKSTILVRMCLTIRP
jgi:glutamine synthetase